MQTIIIGGGITGMSSAWELQNQGRQYILIEATDRWGGKICSRNLETKVGSFLVDGGPDTLVTRKSETWQLVRELGIQNEVVNPGSETKNIFVVDNGKPHPIPLNPYLFFSSKLLTWRGKLRFLAEPFQPARGDDDDESLADFVSRRLGSEASEKFIGPVLGGIYNTDPHKQSIQVSSPVMREMEKEAGSLVLASLSRMRRKKEKGTRLPRFINFKCGMEQLPAAIALKLNGDLRLNSPVNSISKSGSRYAVQLANGETLFADSVILTTLANVSAKLLRDVAPQASQKLAAIEHKNIGTISLIFKESDIPSKPVINGLMIPRREKRNIDAMTFTSRKSPERAVPGFALIRVFFGGGNPDMVTCSEETLLNSVCKELNNLVGIKAHPISYAAFRWEQGFPQAEVGHLERVAAIENLLPAGIYVAGSSYRGIAVPDCIKQGRDAARNVL